MGKKINISEEVFLEKCLELLDHFGVDYSGDTIKIDDGFWIRNWITTRLDLLSGDNNHG